MSSGIYKITNKINNKVYIGQSINIEKRFFGEKNGRLPNKHLRSSFKKYGLDNFKFEIIEECNNLDEREQYWIQHYNSSNRECGYNKTIGGDADGRLVWDSLDEEEQKKISLEAKERWEKRSKEWKEQDREWRQKKYKGNGNPFFGKKHTDETKKKMVKRVLLKETGQIFDSVKDAAIFLGVGVSSISQTKKRKNKCKGFTIEILERGI
jgi:group I intron endonuclease